MCYLRQYLITAIVVFIFSDTIYSLEPLELNCKADLERRKFTGKFKVDKAQQIAREEVDGLYVIGYMIFLMTFNENGEREIPLLDDQTEIGDDRKSDDVNNGGEKKTDDQTKNGKKDEKKDWKTQSSIEEFCKELSPNLTTESCHETLKSNEFTGVHDQDVRTLRIKTAAKLLKMQDYVTLYTGLITALTNLHRKYKLTFDFNVINLLCDGKVSNADGQLHFKRAIDDPIKVEELEKEFGEEDKEFEKKLTKDAEEFFKKMQGEQKGNESDNVKEDAAGNDESNPEEGDAAGHESNHVEKENGAGHDSEQKDEK